MPAASEVLQLLSVLSAIAAGVAAVAAWLSARTASKDLKLRLEDDQRRRANRCSVVVAELGRLRLALGDVPPSESFLRHAMDKRLIPPAFMPWIQALFPDLHYELPESGSFLAAVENQLASFRDRRTALDAAERRIGEAQRLVNRCGFMDGKLTNVPRDVSVREVDEALKTIQDNAPEQWAGMDRAWAAAQAAIDQAISGLTAGGSV